MQNIDETLKERGSRYGVFAHHARITQEIKDCMTRSPKWHILSPSQKEALEMVAHKIGRILNGDPNYADSWVDIAGYAKLVSDELEEATTTWADKPPTVAEALLRQDGLQLSQMPTQPGAMDAAFGQRNIK